MDVVLVDDWLYMDLNGQMGSYGRDEIERNVKSKIKSITASFIDCEIKIIDAPQEAGTQKEALIDASFSQEYLIQEERLSARQYQIIAAKKQTIEDIYNYFKPVKVSAVIPYPISVRAYLNSKSLLTDNRTVIFVDDLKTQAIVTIFEELRFSAPRRISMRDLVYMAGEIKRSLISFQAKQFILVSNNRVWLHSFLEQGLASQENIVHLDSAFVVLEGLKAAKFGINFILPHELARQKRLLRIGERLRTILLIGLPVLLAGCIYLGSHLILRSTQSRLAYYVNERNRIVKELEALNQKKYLNFINRTDAVECDLLYFDFIENTPYGYGIKEFSIKKDGLNAWVFKGIIFPLNEHVRLSSFRLEGLFTKAEVRTLDVNKSLGQQINLSINNSKG